MIEDCYMKSTKRISERRKGKRFKARDGAVAVLYDGEYRVGPVVDLNKRGLSFLYIDDGEKNKRDSQLEIIVAGQGFHLRMMPATTVYDIEEKPKMPSSSIKMRRQGVRFGRLTHYQVMLLKYFLKHFTIDEI